VSTYVTLNKYVPQIELTFILLPIGGRELASSVEVNQSLVLRFNTNTLLHGRRNFKDTNP
jgi:hypothetical protein